MLNRVEASRPRAVVFPRRGVRLSEAEPLESLPSSLAGEVDVEWLYPRVPHHGVPCSVYGEAYTIEFAPAAGDVADLIPVTWNLTGSFEAAAHVREYTKDGEARGDALALPFATPLECSEPKVTSDGSGLQRGFALLRRRPPLALATRRAQEES